MIERKKYLEKLISKKENGLVKVITGADVIIGLNQRNLANKQV